ncbi:UNVERIFIED_CONTAM: hypothetical protein HDU68_000543 [Siphonaria sp. JEL0065]|nr:hypothetical protein HDU68_000543 [Siphonaria sp. JEL0065]
MHIGQVPRELIQEILIHLPIDSNLIEVALASKAVFALFLINNLSFAHRHLKHQQTLKDTEAILDSIVYSSKTVKSEASASIFGNHGFTFQHSTFSFGNASSSITSSFTPPKPYSKDAWIGVPTTYQALLLGSLFSAPTPPHAEINPIFEYQVIRKYFEKAPSSKSSTLVCVLLSNPTFFDPSCQTNRPIRYASYYGNTTFLKLLLSDPRVDPSAKANESILTASEYNHLESVRLLLDSGKVDASAQNDYAIRLVTGYGYLDIIRLLLKAPNVEPQSALNLALTCRKPKVIKLLLEEGGIDLSANDNFAICHACTAGYADVVQVLLTDERVDPAADNNNPIRMASQYGYPEVVKLLLETGRVDPSADDGFALRMALENGHDDIVGLLEEYQFAKLGKGFQ